MSHFSTFSPNKQRPIQNPLKPYTAPGKNRESAGRRESTPPSDRINLPLHLGEGGDLRVPPRSLLLLPATSLG
jgi:hypothetical protein